MSIISLDGEWKMEQINIETGSLRCEPDESARLLNSNSYRLIGGSRRPMHALLQRLSMIRLIILNLPSDLLDVLLDSTKHQLM